MSWGGKSWGTWHTGFGPCPQADGMHTVDEAVALNDKDREYAQATRHARNKEWLAQGAKKPPDPE